MVVKPPSGNQPPVAPTPNSVDGGTVKPTAANTATQAPKGIVNPEAVGKALKEYESIQKKLKKPFLAGAAGLFTDNVVFPADLLDPNNPANDMKYLHLLCAVLNMKELEGLFATPEQVEEKERDTEKGGGQEGKGEGQEGNADDPDSKGS